MLVLGGLTVLLQAFAPGPMASRASPHVVAPVAPTALPLRAVSDPAVSAEHCDGRSNSAALRNDDGLRQLVFAPFHRPETGWQVYEPLVAHEIGTRCGGGTAEFADALASWQAAHGLPGGGVFDAPTFAAMKAAWQTRRTFVAANRQGCPAPPLEAYLAVVPVGQSYGGKTLRLRPRALAAYTSMLASARAALPELRADPQLMTLFSAYRSPDYDAARCARDGNCQGVTRAICSPHRTGLAMDIFLGAQSGYTPDSSEDANRLYITRGVAYRWVVRNAGKFGFVPYAFEPWHWEWIGEPI